MQVNTDSIIQKKGAEHRLLYSVLYSDTEDVTHFRDEYMPWNKRSSGNAVTPFRDAQQIGFLRLHENLKADWHPAPRKQFVMVLKGVMEVEAGDGGKAHIHAWQRAFGNRHRMSRSLHQDSGKPGSNNCLGAGSVNRWHKKSGDLFKTGEDFFIIHAHKGGKRRDCLFQIDIVYNQKKQSACLVSGLSEPLTISKPYFSTITKRRMGLSVNLDRFIKDHKTGTIIDPERGLYASCALKAYEEVLTMIKSMNIAWWVQRWSELHPDKTAIVYEEQRITYRDLHRRADRTSCWFQSLGIEKGDRVAVMLANGPEFIEIYLACSRLGAIFIPVNFRLAGPELEYTLRNARPRLFVFSERYGSSVESLSLDKGLPLMLTAVLKEKPEGKTDVEDRFLDYIRDSKAYDGQSPFLTKSLGPADPEEPHVIMYTSGTTGQPKGAVLSHRKTFFNCLNADIFFKLHFDDVMLVVLPLFHSGGLFIQASPIIYKGATLIIHPRFDPLRTFHDIDRYRVTKFLGVPDRISCTS